MVYVNVFVRSFSKIDDIKMVCGTDFVDFGQFVLFDENFLMFQEYSFQITLRQQWNDKRLKFKEKLEGYGVAEGG